MRFILLLVTLLATAPAVAQDASSSHAVDQAQLFMRKGWHADARDELLRALTTPEGSQNYQVHWLLAQVLYELLEVGRAMEHAEVAAGLTEDPDKQAACWQLVEFYESTFGAVMVLGPGKGLNSRLQLELTSTLFDPELKRFVGRRTLELTEPVKLPHEVWLPAGTYLLNGHEVTVRAGDTVTLDLPLDALGARGMAALQVMRAELGGGFGVLFGSRVTNLHPSLETQLAITQPVKGVLIGLTLTKSFRSFEVEGYEPSGSPLAMSGGARLGTELLLGGPLALRPFLGYRYGFVPGLAFDCHDTRDGLSCQQEMSPEGVTDRFYATGRAHIATAEIGLDYREGGRTNALGLGVRIAVDQLFGAVPSDSVGARPEADDTLDISLQDGSFHATAVRILANLSIAF
jgi:hypothetical protein